MRVSPTFADAVYGQTKGKQSACGGLATSMILDREMHPGAGGGEVENGNVEEDERGGGKGSKDQRHIS